jgi:hypothetical protein
MDEEQFDALMQGRAYGIADAMKFDASLRRCGTLGSALWGKTPEDLGRQLLAAHPQLPERYRVEDYRELLQQTEAISSASRDPRFACFSSALGTSRTISVGGRQLSVWEARCDVVRRAIEYLGNH